MRNRRTLVPVVLAASLLIPAAAFAGPRQGRGHSDRGQGYGHGYGYGHRDGAITVRNDNAVPLEVLVDRQVVGTVDPWSTARFAGIDEGNHRVKVRFNGRNLRFPVLRENVTVGGRHPTRLAVPTVDAGILVVRNDWVEPMTVLVDGRVAGTVAPNSRQVMKARGHRGRVQLVTPGGAVAANEHVSLNALERSRVVLHVPQTGTIAVSNPSHMHRLELVDSMGQRVANLPPGATRMIEQPAGHNALRALYRGRLVQTATVLASPFEPTAWRIDLPNRAPLAVSNPNRFSVDVIVDGRVVGRVEGNSLARFEGVRAGRVQVTMTGAGRRGSIDAVATVDIDPLSGGSVPVPEAFARDGRGGSRYGHDGGRRGDGRGGVYARR